MERHERLLIETIVRDVLFDLVPGAVDDHLDEVVQQMKDYDAWRLLQERAGRRERAERWRARTARDRD
jgi:hypothetical protein